MSNVPGTGDLALKSESHILSDTVVKYVTTVSATIFGTTGFAFWASAVGPDLIFLAIMCGLLSITILIAGIILITVEIIRDYGGF